MKNILLLLILMPLMASSQAIQFNADTIVKTLPAQIPPVTQSQALKSDTTINVKQSQVSTITETQDLILLRSGEQFNAKVVEVGIIEIKYKRTDDGPLYVVKKADVFMITYKDGTKDVFNEIKKGDTGQKKEKYTTEELTTRGKMDARTYYHARRSGSGGVMLTTLILTPVLGLIPAAACAAAPPREENLNMPRTEYSLNPVYFAAYTQEAHKIKKKHIWFIYAGSSVFFLILYFVF